MITRLILLRHGETAWNKQKRYCGRMDVALSSVGRRQAERLAKKMAKISVDVVYASDRKRALQTAEIVFKGARIIKEKGLREISFGVMEGMRHQEILWKYPAEYRNWLKDPYRHDMPRAEPMRVFKKRVHEAALKIVSANRGRTVAAACHGGVISVIVSQLLKKKEFWRYVPKAASMTVIEYSRGTRRLKMFNNKVQ
jgi:broad specificity phosphatase PhoE